MTCCFILQYAVSSANKLKCIHLLIRVEKYLRRCHKYLQISIWVLLLDNNRLPHTIKYTGWYKLLEYARSTMSHSLLFVQTRTNNSLASKICVSILLLLSLLCSTFSCCINAQQGSNKSLFLPLFAIEDDLFQLSRVCSVICLWLYFKIDTCFENWKVRGRWESLHFSK